MQKAYNRIIWHNKPDTRSPINESNLNRMDIGLDTVDDRVITLDTTKANQTDLLTCVASITFNQSTGILTITLQNGTSTTIDTGLSKLAVNFDYDDDPTSPHYQQLILEMKDGTYKYIDLSALINQFEFDNSSTVVFSVDAQTGHISAIVPDGSITESKLQPNFLADCRTEKTQAQAARVGAETAESNAEGFTEDAEAWANGEINGEPVPDTHPAYHNNAKYYKDLANPTTFKALTDVTTDQNFNGIDMSGIQDGQTIVFDNTTGEMVPGDAGGAAINDMFNVYGSKNLMPFPYYGTDCPIATIKDDGTIVYNGQRTQGMSSKVEIYNQPTIAKGLVLPAGNYKLSMEVDNIESQYMVFNTKLIYKEDIIQAPAHEITVANDGSGLFTTSFTLPSNVYIVSIYVEFMGYNFVLSNITVKSMLRRATVKDDTYASPAMTNHQLTLKHNVKDMNDAVINNPTPGQTLVYNNDGKLENATPSGSGHTMINSAGNQLPQRTGLQGTGGLNVTDDSNNNRTVIDDEYETIPWTTWQGYSAAQKAQHPNAIVTGAPDCDGDVEIENWKDLWTNNNYSSAFTSSNVILNSDDYDFLYFDCLFANTNYRRTLSIIIPKGQNGQIPVSTSTGNGIGVFWRNITRVSDTEYVISDCSLKDISTSTTTNNALLIPYKIYGFKKKLTTKIKAIAHDVSTSASKCMLDENTSVKDKLTAISATFTPSSGFTLMYNNSRIVNGIFYIDLMLRASTAVTARVNVGYFTNGSVSGYKRFTTYGSSSANGILDRFANGYINVNQLWIGDGATGSMIDIGVCIAIPV